MGGSLRGPVLLDWFEASDPSFWKQPLWGLPVLSSFSLGLRWFVFPGFSLAH